MVLTGLRGVGKTVLLNTFRSMALQRLWGTGKLEARPDQSIRRPVASALHMAVRELAPRHRAPDRIDDFLGVLKAFALRDPKAPKGIHGQRPVRHRRARRARPGRLRRPRGRPDRAVHRRRLGRGRPGRRHRPVRRRDAGHARATTCPRCAPPATSSPRSAGRSSWSARACRTCPRCCRRARAIPNGCFATPGSTGWTGRRRTRRCIAPAEREDVLFKQDALDALYEAADGYPYFVQAYGKVTWDVAAASPISAGRRRPSPRPRPRASSPSGSSARGTSAPPRPSASTCARWPRSATSRCRPRTSPTSSAASRRASRPARDGLIKKGLIYSSERGLIAFTVPHFGKFLRSQPV